ncbi:hypothetical protein An08g03540 [Aspergillus niger]|uniref:Uncharacterized protein n=2 Tax=Aspergillus niger TaxID=5061 RepID=A2QQS5_ASPNC|nr:hypothetical protein An08g03540 [Aspergillus niger]CAK45391.1 hypothetical protein An08g03540 [Aspergillus niger]
MGSSGRDLKIIRSDFFFGTGSGKIPVDMAKDSGDRRKQNCDKWTPEGGSGDSLRETAETEREDEARRIGGEAEV